MNPETPETPDTARLAAWTARARALLAQCVRHDPVPEMARHLAAGLCTEFTDLDLVDVTLSTAKAAGDDALLAALDSLGRPWPGTVARSLDCLPAEIRAALQALADLDVIAGYAEPTTL